MNDLLVASIIAATGIGALALGAAVRSALPYIRVARSVSWLEKYRKKLRKQLDKTQNTIAFLESEAQTTESLLKDARIAARTYKHLLRNAEPD